jgi:uncharacterized cupin superfamily protein
MSVQKFSTPSILSMALSPLATADGIPRAAHELTMPGREGADLGIWESEPCSLERTVKEGEIMHILAGEATFTSSEGEHIDIGPGDTLVFSPNTLGRWVITKTLRKFYVLL